MVVMIACHKFRFHFLSSVMSFLHNWIADLLSSEFDLLPVKTGVTVFKHAKQQCFSETMWCCNC